MQAIVTPSLGQEFPDPRFFMYWGMHFLSVWAAGWLAATGGGPTWRGYRLAVVVTAVVGRGGDGVQRGHRRRTTAT